MALLLAALAIPGCGGGGITGDAVIELGTGTVEFEALDDGDPLTLIAGPQGGFHFVVHARATGIIPGDPTRPGAGENPSTSFRASRQDSGRRIDDGRSAYRLGYESITGAGELDLALPSGRILRIDDAEVEDTYGQSVILEVTVRDADGDVASDSRVVIAEPDPDGPQAAAARSRASRATNGR